MKRLIVDIASVLSGNYHDYDYQLAYMNIRRNASERMRAFLSGRP